MFDVAIVGAGFSGSLLALQLLRLSDNSRVFLVERGQTFGRGLAYGAADPDHILNVRAANMSAFTDDSGHFVEWLRLGSSQDEAPPFVPRQVFGAYLQELLRKVAQSWQGAGRLFVVADEVVSLTLEDAKPRLRLALGRDLAADHIVLATGNLPPQDFTCLAGAGPAVYISNPWAPDAFARLQSKDDVLLVGTGLTAIDMVLRLQGLGHQGMITALSRHGLQPRRHTDAAPTTSPLSVPARPAVSALLRLARQQARTRSWHEVVDGLRPSVQRLWCESSIDERRRFLRHLRPWWDVHRHRIAPVVADVIDDLRLCGRLRFLAGRINAIALAADEVDVTVRPRGETRQRKLRIRRMVNCTGPAGDFTKARSPLIQNLLARGLARPDACGLGLDVDADCRVVDASGQAQSQLLAIGPMSRGTFWEITSVPDIRTQVVRVAACLTALAVS